MELIEKNIKSIFIFYKYCEFAFYEFSIAFTLISILWIAIVGIVTPVLIISVIAFGYYGIIVAFLSIVLASMINFFMVTKTKSVKKN